MILPKQNKHHPQQRLKIIPQNDASYRYFKGQPYISSFFNRLAIFFNIGGYLQQLQAFYPYQRAIKATVTQYISEKKKTLKSSILISFASCIGLFNLARKGYVMPIYSKYDKIFGIHRIFRQYITIIFLPYILMTSWLNWKYLNHTQNFWAIHARRLNNKILQDPRETVYPPELNCKNFSAVWRPTFVDPVDLQTKWQNQVNYFQAPDFQPIQIQDLMEQIEQEEQAESTEQAEQSEIDQQQSQSAIIDTKNMTYRNALSIAGIHDQKQIPIKYRGKLQQNITQSGDDELTTLIQSLKEVMPGISKE